jgi:hypothetical protein
MTAQRHEEQTETREAEVPYMARDSAKQSASIVFRKHPLEGGCQDGFSFPCLQGAECDPAAGDRQCQSR